jgi:HSP20 family protein
MRRYDPFRAIEDMMSAMVFRPVLFDEKASPSIRIDASENDKSYVIDADIPGVKKEDIKVSIQGNEVSISAEVKQEKDVKEGERVVHSERHYGKVSRTFRLGYEVDEAKAQAKYADGMLELVLPKKANTSHRQLTIQ